jgi:hypothetical protein
VKTLKSKYKFYKTEVLAFILKFRPESRTLCHLPLKQMVREKARNLAAILKVMVLKVA